jgi:hypothetical protein
MRVVMVLSREVQDSGRAKTLDVGQPYELSDVVASALVAEGAAHAADERRGLKPPETKPLAPPETK